MTGEKSVLVIGLDPTLIDFSQPGYGEGMDATKVFAGLKSSADELTRLGYSVDMCLTDFGDTAEAVVQRALQQQRFDCVLIGAGVRANPFCRRSKIHGLDTRVSCPTKTLPPSFSPIARPMVTIVPAFNGNSPAQARIPSVPNSFVPI